MPKLQAFEIWSNLKSVLNSIAKMEKGFVLKKYPTEQNWPNCSLHTQDGHWAEPNSLLLRGRKKQGGRWPLTVMARLAVTLGR